MQLMSLYSNSSSRHPSTSEHKSVLINTDSDDDHDIKLPHNNKKESCCQSFLNCFKNNKNSSHHRILNFNNGTCNVFPKKSSFPKNAVNNRKYNTLTFLPLFFFDQFKQFWNAYFLIVALTQLPFPNSIFEPMQVGLWWTQVAPLVFVLAIAFLKEAFDEFKRSRRDAEINNELFEKIIHTPSDEYGIGAQTEFIPASKIQVGDLIILEENQRVPCDMILLWCSNPSNDTFIRTDQLDGETDWKLRKPISSVQTQFSDMNDLHQLRGRLKCEPPHKQIYEFLGNFELINGETEALNVENTLWSSTVIASGKVVGIAIYTGCDTRQSLNANESVYKIGRIDSELNFYAKCLFVFMVVLSVMLTFGKGLHSQWYIFLGRYILLLSAILPISLRVHMDMAKLFFSRKIQMDKQIPNTVVRTTTIPEELGRIEYLFSDKTGTLTQNEMVFRKLQLTPPLMYDATENLDILQRNLKAGFDRVINNRVSMLSVNSTDSNGSIRRNKCELTDIILQMALCHNVTPIISSNDSSSIDYQASSPDEVALVRFCEQCGVTLYHRTPDEITLRINLYDNEYEMIKYEILQIFPFTSESKRMGIIVRNTNTKDIIFYVKGADNIMRSLIDESNSNEWMEEEVENLSREGLRTLVFAQKYLNDNEYEDFNDRYHNASIAMKNRNGLMESVREYIEQNLTLTGVTGVEDKLQDNVQFTLETLRNAHIKTWMLTGDKVETAKVIARSSKLVSYGQEFFDLIVKDQKEAIHKLDLYGAHLNYGAAVVIDGSSLDLYLTYYKSQLIENIVEAPAVICCRCSPQQKAEMVELVQNYTGKICASIGDGGNDVAMIQKANLGIGIMGKEGQQAAMAADVSIEKFENISRLILWHGRIAYKNTAKMAQYVIHRGVIIALMQCLYSAIFYFSAIPIFTGMVAVGYTCAYTSAPVFVMILDRDVKSEIALFYPELYHALQKGTSLNSRTMLAWMIRSIFQAGVIMVCSLWLFEGSFHQIMNISFTALIITELLNISLEIKQWHWLMVLAEFVSVCLFFISIFLPLDVVRTAFDWNFIMSSQFWWKSMVTGIIATVPLIILKVIHKKIHPSTHTKLKRQDNNSLL